MNNLFYDGFNSKLIETAFFEGMLEIPILEAPNETILPSVAVPFSERKKIVETRRDVGVLRTRSGI